MLRAALVALALTLSAIPVTADTLDDAREAYQAGDYETVVRLYRMLADQGDADAQFNLGYMYATGKGVPADDAEAAKWYRMAAEQGDAEAQTVLGAMYFGGKGVPQDDIEAAKWYRRAAEQGFAVAQTNLGLMYLNGRGVPQDDAQAYEWLDLAAAQGEYLAKEGLATLEKLRAAKAEEQRLLIELMPEQK